MYPPIITEITSITRYIDDENTEWIVINQDTHYQAGMWTEAEAIADYQNIDNAIARANAEWSTWTD